LGLWEFVAYLVESAFGFVVDEFLVAGCS